MSWGWSCHQISQGWCYVLLNPTEEMEIEEWKVKGIFICVVNVRLLFWYLSVCLNFRKEGRISNSFKRPNMFQFRRSMLKGHLAKGVLGGCAELRYQYHVNSWEFFLHCLTYIYSYGWSHLLRNASLSYFWPCVTNINLGVIYIGCSLLLLGPGWANSVKWIQAQDMC